MPGSHPSNSPVAGSRSAMDHATIESDAYPNRQRSSEHQRSHHDANEMAVELHLSGLSSPGDSSALTSGRNSIDHNSGGGINHGDLTEMNFAARFSEFMRSTRRDASSERPVIETYIDNEDYQSLLAAVSSINMSHDASSREDASITHHGHHVNQAPTHSPYVIQEDQGNNQEQMLRVQDDEEEYNSQSNSPMEDIYDLQHIMVHNQRQLEDQMHQAREAYARHTDSGQFESEIHHATSPGRASNPFSYETLDLANTASRGTPEGVLRQPFHDIYHADFDPRPTISSSYFSPTTESTIVLSSPPPGRSSSMFPYNTSVHPHTILPGYTVETSSVPRDASPLRHGNGPYRPFVTGRDVSREQEQRQEQLPEQEQQRPYHQSISLSTRGFSSPDLSEDELDRDGGRVTAGENDSGHWSTYGSLAQLTRSFEQHRYQYYRRQQQQHRQHRGSTRHHRTDIAHSTMNGTMETTQTPSRSVAADLDSRRATSFSQSSTSESLRRGPHALTSSSYSGSSIPIPSRYINLQPFSHPHYTSSTILSSSSHLLRPHNIMTSYNHHNGYHRPTVANDYNSSGSSRRRTLNTYSETVERAEAGGWIPPSLSATARSSAASWYESPIESRTRTNIGLKEVVRMACRFCNTVICERGMKAQLLADQSVALLSTDDAPHSVQLIGADYKPTNCLCKIKDTACLVCGNAIGYHITQPCEKCLSAENNGHLWLFHPEYVCSSPRWDYLYAKPLRWGELPEPDQDFETLSLRKVHQGGPGGRLILGGMVRREYDAICR